MNPVVVPVVRSDHNNLEDSMGRPVALRFNNRDREAVVVAADLVWRRHPLTPMLILELPNGSGAMKPTDPLFPSLVAWLDDFGD